MGSIKENLIRDYISNINFKSEDWGLSQIKEDMRLFLGEEPGIDISWDKDVLFNEIIGESKEVLKINNITIVFTDIDNKFKKLKFTI